MTVETIVKSSISFENLAFNVNGVTKVGRDMD